MAGDYMEGNDAKNIRVVTRAAVLEYLAGVLEENEFVVGAEGIELVKSADYAGARFGSGKPFIYVTQRPTKSSRCQVLDRADNSAHSGRRYDWQFLIQVSAGKIKANVTSEVKEAADDVLIDVVREAFEAGYVHFRNELHFYKMNIEMVDEPQRETSLLNPMILSFYNKARMPVDEFLSI